MSCNKQPPQAPPPLPPAPVVPVSDPTPKSVDASSDSPAPSEIPGPEHELGVGPARKNTQERSLKWVDVWLSNRLGMDLISHNKIYPTSLDKLTPSHVTEDHMIAFVSTFGSWFACNPLEKLHGTGLLYPTSKITYFKSVKKGLARLFPHHSLLSGRDDKWWLDIVDRFTRDANSFAQKDHNQFKDIKSSPLYRDTSKELPMDDLNAMNSPEAMY